MSGVSVAAWNELMRKDHGKMSIMDIVCDHCGHEIPLLRNAYESEKYVSPHDSTGTIRRSWPNNRLCPGSFATVDSERVPVLPGQRRLIE